MTATEKYLTHKAKMSFRADNYNTEIQTKQSLKQEQAVLLEERDSDETSADE